MKYRPLQSQSEIDNYVEMLRLAFNVPPDELALWQSIAPVGYESARGLFDDHGTLLCAMEIIAGGGLYFRTEQPVPAALITSVASPPEHRRKGYIRELFMGMFAEQRAAGVSLTALYPFYFPFYRAFGYELSHDAIRYTVKMGQFRPWRKSAERGTFTPISVEAMRDQSSAELAALNGIYEQWARRNMANVARNRSWWWLGRATHKAYFTPAFLYRDESGTPKGFIFYHFEDKENFDRDMVVHELLASDLDAEEALFGFVYNHDSQASKVVLRRPIDSAFAARLPDPREAEGSVRPGYMLRLLDVAEAFRRRQFAAEAQGEFSFSVTDEMIPENSGTYRVCVRDGKAEAEKIDGGSAGLQTDERGLAQLYGGYLSPTRAVQTGILKVSREEDLRGMETALYPAGQPAPYMADGF